MGYQKVTLIPGFNFVAPQFTAVGGGPIDLQSIKLDIADDDASGADNIQILDEGGAAISQYFWMPKDATGAAKSGWVDENFELVDETLDNGLSVLVDSTDDLSVTISGEVSTNTTEVVAVAGFNFVGNSTPVAINIQDIQIDVADDDATGADNIQILDDGGAATAQYFWMPKDATGAAKTGWVDENFELVDVELDPGQGVLLDATEDGITITVPAAIQ